MARSTDELFDIVSERLVLSRAAQDRRDIAGAWVHSLVAMSALAAMTSRVMTYDKPMR